MYEQELDVEPHQPTQIYIHLTKQRNPYQNIITIFQDLSFRK